MVIIYHGDTDLPVGRVGREHRGIQRKLTIKKNNAKRITNAKKYR